MRTIYESYDPVTQRATEVTSDSDGLTFIHSQNTKPIVESAKALAANFDPLAKRPDEIVHVARIPRVVWNELERLGITRDQKALDRWLNERDNRVFRTDDGRKL
jgi:hypothetical protein